VTGDQAVFQAVADRLRANARAFPDRPALRYPAGEPGVYHSRTFAEIDRDSDALAAGLAGAGLRAGHRTIVMTPVGPDLVTLVFALFKAGAVPIIVDPGMGLRRILHCYRMVGAQAFIGIPAMHLLRWLRPRVFGQVRLSVTTGRQRWWGALTMRDLGRSAGPPPRIPVGPDDLMMISFTTGSTGAAKGVEFTYGSLDATIRTAISEYGHTPDDVGLVTSMPFLFLHLLIGATSVLPGIDFRRVARADPAVVAQAIVEHRVTTMFASPALLDPLARHLSALGRRLPSPRRVVSGGAPVSADLVAQLREVLGQADANVYATYGATEATPIASIESRDLLRPDTRSASESGAGVCVGTPIGGTHLRIVRLIESRPLTCVDLPAGEVGEILVSGPVVSRRYLAPPEANETTKLSDGGRLWHRTGDVGRLDDRGRLWFCGRRDDIVTTAHGPLYPVRCESVLNVHDEVYRTAVVGVGRAGAQRPVVCVELHPGIAGREWRRIAGEMGALAARHSATRELTRFIRHPAFPVDVRHNAKISRVALAEWAARRRSRWDAG
jgi:acyl-CoA synthetase (AMP-forming)/AMP-acid ligase II